MSNLDISLDDMIKMNKKSRASENPRSRPRNSGPGPSRRLPNRASKRSTPYGAPKVEAPDTTWGHDMYESHAAGRPARSNQSSGIETGTKLLVSNLDYGVSNEDIKELFAEVGDLKRATIHYDRSGRSKGTAEIVFSRRRDAELAIKRYDNVQLDGKPMKIELVGTNIGNDGGPNNANGNQSGAPRRGGVMGRLRGGGQTMTAQGGGGGRGGGGGGGRGGRGKGRGRGGERAVKVSAEDLDADLEKYHAGSMQTD
ncbi:THO complex subunit 4A-like [Bidens hawaiensis]|uniref:THO complex subunit 4A-like n=1 Tax=Bidens hawaiensis TaxID=980011 RepID=UPI0040498F03